MAMRSKTAWLDRWADQIKDELKIAKAAAAGPNWDFDKFLQQAGYKNKAELLVRTAIQHGLTHMLREMERTGIWKPQESTDALFAAASANRLVELLAQFPLPLAHFPQMAEAHYHKAVAFLKKASLRGAGACGGDPPSLGHSSRAKPGVDARGCGGWLRRTKGLLKELTQDMLVLHRATQQPLSVDVDFPATLSGLCYLRREWTLTPKEGQSPRRAESQIQVSLEGKVLKSDKLFGKAEIMTSSFSKVNLPLKSKVVALIPMGATHFAYIHQGKHFPLGGFVYAQQPQGSSGNDNLELIAINAISESRQSFALSFREAVNVTAEQCESLQGERCKVTYMGMREKGCTECAWVPPCEKEEKGDLKTQYGGFLFVFQNLEDKENPEDYRYFGIQECESSEVVERAVFLVGELHSALLPCCATGADVERYVTRTNMDSSTSSRFRTQGVVPMGTQEVAPMGTEPQIPMHVRAWEWVRSAPYRFAKHFGGDVPVRVARLRVPGVLHPVVLRGVAVSPSADALDTVAAKAIAYAAYEFARPLVALDACFDFVALLCIWRVTDAVRNSRLGPGIHGYLIFLLVAWLYTAIFKELNLFLGYARRSWTSDYFRWMTLLAVIYLATLLAVIILAVSPDEDTSHKLRPLLAAVGACLWLRLLLACRGLQIFRLGKRILPMFAVLGEILDYLIINACCLGAYVQACFALTGEGTDIRYILFMTYRMGLLNNFDVNKDVLFRGDTDTDPAPWDNNANLPLYISFILFSFVLYVVMINIFIGVMSNAIDTKQKQAPQLFVRSRARIGLEHSLRTEVLQLLRCLRRRSAEEAREEEETHMVWFCYKCDADADADAGKTIEMKNCGDPAPAGAASASSQRGEGATRGPEAGGGSPKAADGQLGTSVGLVDTGPSSWTPRPPATACPTPKMEPAMPPPPAGSGGGAAGAQPQQVRAVPPIAGTLAGPPPPPPANKVPIAPNPDDVPVTRWGRVDGSPAAALLLASLPGAVPLDGPGGAVEPEAADRNNRPSATGVLGAASVQIGVVPGQPGCVDLE